MNIRKFKFPLYFLFFLLPTIASAQRLGCPTHELTNEILANSPEKRALREALEHETELYTAEHYGERAGNLKIIPTVIHVIHDNGSENLSKQAILNALEVVNEELTGQNGNLSSIVPAFSGIIGDPGFELRLAKIDVNGNCTDGITRTTSAQTYAGGEDVKDLINWNTGSRRYLQVWLVNSVDGGAGGYTFLPGTNGAESNGIILRAAQFQGSLAHEFGHWMNLSHIWGPTNEPGVASNCSFDDDVTDTPNTIGTSGSCSTTQTTCGSLDNVQNHMDYSSCGRMFTMGQAARMQAASNSTTGGRNSYWTTGNRSSTGTSDGFTNTCVPTIDFSFDNSLGCEGLEVDYFDNSWGADVDASWVWTWSFPGGTPSTSNDQSPTVVYNAAGTYSATLSISTAAGTESQTIQNAVTINPLGGGITGPFDEGVEASNFPNNADPDLEWTIETPGGLTWQRNTSASFSGTASARINLRSVTAGNVNSLISPAIDMTNVSSADASMTFRVAHANRSSTSHSERLRVYASKDCGESWSLRYTQAGDNLNTAGGSVSGTFTPDASDWRLDEVSLATMAGEEHVLIKFEALSDQQSYLYIDDININPNNSGTGVSETGLFERMVLYPNPTQNEAILEISAKDNSVATMSVLNVLGQEQSVRQLSVHMGTNRIDLSQDISKLSNGIYLIQLRAEGGLNTIRFVKN